MGLKILVAGDPYSIHTARFTSLLQEIGYDVRVFQCEHHYGQDEHLRNTAIYVHAFEAPPENGNTLKITHPVKADYRKYNWVLFKTVGKALYHYYKKYGKRDRKYDLTKIIHSWCPDLVFSLKMQNDGYTVSDVKEILGDGFKPEWIHFNWGTDVEFFGKHPEYIEEHLPKIRKLLSQCKFLMADCKRDLRQAREYGFNGVLLGECPGPGGFDLGVLEGIKAENAEERNIILVKGREGGFVGRAFNVLAALEKIPRLVKGYRVKIMMPSPDVRGAARYLSRFGNVKYDLVPRIPYKELLGLFARSRVAVSASDVDGTPNFMIESMAMGALPIHSDMESVREWLDDGVNGLLFPVDDVDALRACFERALTDDRLVEDAREKNWQIAVERMDRDKIRDQVKRIIERDVMAGKAN